MALGDLQVHSANAPLRRAGGAIPSTNLSFVHPDYDYWQSEWEACRDTFIGQKAIKDKNVIYLPKLEAQDQSQYDTYLKRAIFYNMVARTVNGLLGTVFRRDPKYVDLPTGVDMTKVTRKGESMRTFLKRVAQEILLVGRYGVLVDATPQGTPYMCGYVTENILDWETTEIDGEEVLQSVLLREVVTNRDGTFGPRRFMWRFRKLVLDYIDMNPFNGIFPSFDPETEEEIAPIPDIRLVYQQWVYDIDPGKLNREPNFAHREPNSVIVPTKMGEPFDRIPFWFFGAHSNQADIEKPPLLDIVELNLSHYLNYAELQHGRFYTAQPIFYVPTSNTRGTYRVGPDTVWEVDAGQKPGILEYNGHGLRFLESALEDIEDQASAIGGRFMTQQARGAAESDNTLKLKEANERSLLINLVGVIDDGMTQAARFWMFWSGVSQTRADRSRIEMNQDFLLLEAGAREFRAVAGMWKDGQLPGEIVFEYFKRFEVIPDWMDYEAFKRMMSDPEQFMLQVDALARMQGFPDARSQLEITEREKDREHETDLQDDALEAQQEQAETNAEAMANRPVVQSPGGGGGF